MASQRWGGSDERRCLAVPFAASRFHSPCCLSSPSPRALLPFWDMYQEEVNERLQSRKSMFAAVYIACTAHSILGV
jgi:hypothetical protein